MDADVASMAFLAEFLETRGGSAAMVDGWYSKTFTRPGTASTYGVYYHPNGEAFNSHKEVARHLGLISERPKESAPQPKPVVEPARLDGAAAAIPLPPSAVKSAAAGGGAAAESSSDEDEVPLNVKVAAHQAAAKRKRAEPAPAPAPAPAPPKPKPKPKPAAAPKPKPNPGVTAGYDKADATFGAARWTAACGQRLHGRKRCVRRGGCCCSSRGTSLPTS